MTIRIGIMGYGNLGRGVECALKHNPDMKLTAVFTRRDPETVKILTEGVKIYRAEEAASMAGVVAAAPVLAIILKPIIVPIYSLFGADASMFATTLLACDMGGYPLAIQLAGDNAAVGNFAGLILGTMMGPTLVFTIPVALSIIKKEDRPYLGAGIFAGMITIPIGCIVGGLVVVCLFSVDFFL